MNNTVIIILFIVGIVVAYCLGRSHPVHSIGKIVISDSDDPELQGKVQFIFDEEIEDLIQHKVITMDVRNELTKKYNHDNEEH